MQSATGQYSTQAGEPEQPVQHSLITARICGLRLRCVVVPSEIGACLTTVPALYSSILGAEYATSSLKKSGNESIIANAAEVAEGPDSRSTDRRRKTGGRRLRTKRRH